MPEPCCEESLALIKILGYCQIFLPHGYLFDIVRQVVEDGRDPIMAWEALKEMLAK